MANIVLSGSKATIALLISNREKNTDNSRSVIAQILPKSAQDCRKGCLDSFSYKNFLHFLKYEIHIYQYIAFFFLHAP